MANEFDQFDPTNAFDQFDAPAQKYGTYDVGPNGERYPVGSPEARAAISPVAGQNVGQNALQGLGKFYTDIALGTRQIAQPVDLDVDTSGGLIGTPGTYDNAALLAEAAEKRKLDAPLQGTVGGKIGQMAGALPLAFVPGANEYLGAAALGAGMGALQPIVGGESRLLNSGVSAGLSVAGKFGGDKLTGWLTSRAAEPFMGWKPSTVDSAAADALGVSGSAPNQNVLGAAKSRFTDIFSQARNPNVTIGLGQPTMDAFDTAANSLNASRRDALLNNSDITDLLNSATTTGTTTAKKLGDISTSLRQDAIQNLTTEGGDRAVGKSLMAMREHVEDLIQGSIQDPELAQAYAAARPQYRDYLNITHSPTILNSATGRLNATALGKYLQGADETGYMLGQNKSPLYQAARWGQATGEGRGPPPLLRHFGLDWAGYRAVNNPLTNAIGGATSRLGAPVAPAISTGFQGLAFGTVPLALPYLEE